MEQAIEFVFKQIPIVIFCCFVIYFLIKEKLNKEKEKREDDKLNLERIERLVNEHKEEIKTSNEYIRTRDVETIGALKDFLAILEHILDEIEHINKKQ